MTIDLDSWREGTVEPRNHLRVFVVASMDPLGGAWILRGVEWDGEKTSGSITVDRILVNDMRDVSGCLANPGGMHLLINGGDEVAIVLRNLKDTPSKFRFRFRASRV